MPQVAVALGDRSYTIELAPGLLGQVGQRIALLDDYSAAVVVADAAVAVHYLEPLLRSLGAYVPRVESVLVAPGESSKSVVELGRLWRELAGLRLDRHSVVIALGGGVIGDLAGFAAATYLRGIDFVQVPTTLLAQVDASVGGKTAIDLPEGKNLVGAFHQPRAVFIDPSTLATLSAREFAAGMAEVVKTAVIGPAGMFERLESNPDARRSHERGGRAESVWLAQLIEECCRFKADVVTEDERETGRRAILNYGHTVGHAVEAAAGFGTYLHGEAVSIGLVAAGLLSQELEGYDPAQAARVAELLQRLRLPVRLRSPIEPESLLMAARHDKKAVRGGLRFVLARGQGNMVVREVDDSSVIGVLRRLQPEASGAPQP